MVTWFGVNIPEVPDQLQWSWIDPGAMALIGAASFFGGVSRLTMSLTVIMVSFLCSVFKNRKKRTQKQILKTFELFFFSDNCRVFYYDFVEFKNMKTILTSMELSLTLTYSRSSYLRRYMTYSIKINLI